jgi:hypothetical protein
MLPVSPRSKKYQIGILIRDRQVILTKVRHTPSGTQILMIRRHRFTRDLGRFRELNQCLSTLPQGFFANSTINLCVPFRQFLSQRVSLPTLNERDKIAALSHLVDRRHEVWDYEEYSRPPQNTHHDIMLHKLKRSSLEAYIKLCQKYCDRITAVTTEPILLRRLFDTHLVEKVPGPFIMMDLSFRHLKIYVFVNDQITYYRVIPLGLGSAIQALTRTYRKHETDIVIDANEARSILQNISLFDYATIQHDYPLDRLFFQCRPFFEKIALECQKTIQFYIQKNGATDFQSIVLMGGFLRVKGLQTYLQTTLNIPVNTLKYHNKLTQENKDQESRFEESVCMAIAASLPQRAPQPFNMLSTEYLTFQRIKKWAPKTFSLFFLWGFCLAGFGMYRNVIVQDLTTQAAQHRLTMQSIQTAEALMRAKRPASENPEYLRDIEIRLASRAPIEPLLHHFSQKLPEGLRFSSLHFTQTSFTITGTFESQNPQEMVMGQMRQMLPKSKFASLASFALGTPAQITALIENVESLPYIQNIQYDRKKTTATTFELSGGYRL